MSEVPLLLLQATPGEEMRHQVEKMTHAQVDQVLAGIVAASEVVTDLAGLEGNEPFGLQVMADTDDAGQYDEIDETSNDLQAADDEETRWGDPVPTWSAVRGTQKQDDGGTGPGDESSFHLG